MVKQSELDYHNKMNDLFKKWKKESGTVEYSVKGKTQTLFIDHKNSVFIKDGVVCPQKWFTQEIRPLFLLKEAYGGDGDWNLVEDYLCTESPISKTWKRVSLWAKGILFTTKNYIVPFSYDDIAVKYYGNEYLKQIAVINVKKSGGKKSSEMETIRAYAEFDKDRLKEQLELCDPTVIVCGYTASVLDIITGENVRANYNSNLIYKIVLNNHDVLVLDYWHPANQYPDIMNYYGLMGIYQLGLRS